MFLNKINQRRNFLILAIISLVFLIVLSPTFVSAAKDEPDVTTRSAKDIEENRATLRGSVDGNDLNTSAWFEYGRDKDLDDTNTTSHITYGDDEEDFEINISRLSDDTTYYFRAVARNSEGTDYGSILSFRTDESYNDNNNNDEDEEPVQASKSLVPQALTQGATGVTNTSAELRSLLVNESNSPANSWFEWGTTPNLGNKTVTMPLGSIASIRHVDNLTGLAPGTNYYFRAVAENSYWRNNGAVLSFMTSGVNTRGTIQYPPNTIIIREPVIIRVPVPTPVPTPVPVPTPAPAPTPAPSPKPSPSPSPSPTPAQSASIVGGTQFLPQNVFGWLILIVLFLILALLIRQVYKKAENDYLKH